MPDVIVPPAANANSFATVADGDAYHATRLRSDAWDDADTIDKEKALIQATRILNRLFARVPSVVVLSPSLDVPQNLKEATAEFARQLLEAERTADNELARQGITRLKAGPVDLEFDHAQATGGGELNVLPDAVKVLLLPEWWVVPNNVLIFESMGPNGS
jgi:hypothetical protein